MKKTLAVLALVGVTSLSFGQGKVNFSNSSSTLISVNGISMPAQTSSLFYFAVFIAPSTTVTSAGQSAGAFTNPAFQQVGATNVNHATAAGRLQILNGVDVGGSGGGTVDFLVRGWAANMGTTWAEALAFYNATGSGAIGQSTIGDNIILGDGGAITATTLFGAGLNQVGGFNIVVPEPSSMALAGLGAASLLLFRRRK